MDIREHPPVVEVSDQEILIDFELDAKCRTTITLKSLSPTSPVAFKVQTSSPHKFPSSWSHPSLFLRPHPVHPQASTPPAHVLPSLPLRQVPHHGHPLEPQKSTGSVNSLLSHQARYNIKLKVAFGGWVLLRHAVECGDVVKVRNLMKKDKSLLAEMREDEARVLLGILAGLGGGRESDMVKALIDAGLKEERAGDSRPLDGRVNPRGEEIFAAARHGDVELLQSLLHDTARTTTTFRDRNGLTALHAAAIKGYEEVVRLLLETGISIDARDDEGHTPLYLAVECGEPGTVGAPIDWRADVNARNKGGASPLDIATSMGIEEIAEMLLKRGALPALQFASCSLSSHQHPPNQNQTETPSCLPQNVIVTYVCIC